MKKLLVLLVVLLALGLAACTPAEEEETFELALITDIGTIDDKSFNQGAWEGLKQYAEEKDISYKYYQPTEKSTDAYVAAIDLAVENGAKVVVTPGFLFEPAIFKAQDMHPDVKFVLLDGFPQDGTYTEFRIEDNVYSVFYAEEQVGFLAGYAAVKDGFTNLGFMGGMAVPAVVRFGYGFVQGANYAAAELGVNVNLKFKYLGGFGPSPDYQTEAATWFQGGVQVIFAAAGGAGSSVMAAAEANNGKVIGVDIDQKAESTTVITSAMKGLGISVYDALADYYAGSFKGGESVFLGVEVDGVSLPNDFSRFTTFNKAAYDAIFAKLVANTDNIRTNIKKDTDVTSASELPVTNVTVEVIG
jgi:basic membrane protein A and related proteins